MIKNKCQEQFVKYAKQIAQYSGRLIFRKGNQEGCVSHQNLKYALVEIGLKGQDTSAYIGVCAPQSCNSETIKLKINNFLETVKSSLDVQSISINPQNYQTEMGLVSFVTLFILFFLIFVALYVTIRNIKKKKQEKNTILDSFDIIENMGYFKIRENEALNIFDGIRAVSMMWVVFGHVFSFYLGAGLSNTLSITQVISEPFFLIIQGGTFAVDIFFMLGGFFLSYVFLRQNMKKISFLGVAVLQRILRIWPAYIITMLIYYTLFMQFGSGIFWDHGFQDVDACRLIWAQILFIGNFIGNGQTICLKWSWYLQVQFQLFLAGILILFIYYRSKAVSFTIACILSIGSTMFVIVYTFIEEVKIYAVIQSLTNPNYFLNVYIKPWGRCTPYFMGLVLGVMFVQYRKAIKEKKSYQHLILGKIQRLCQNRKVRIAFEWFGIGLMSLIVFIPRSVQTGSIWPQLAHTCYWGFARSIFVLGVILTVLPTILGYRDSFFNLILTSKLFHFLARISFCTYLIHLMVVNQFTNTRNYDVYYALVDTFVIYFGLLGISLFFGLLMTIFVELPFSKLQKSLLQYLAKRRENNTKQQPISNEAIIHIQDNSYSQK